MKMTDRERAIQAIRRGVPLGQVVACSCHRSPPVRNGCFGVCEDAVEAIVASYEAVRAESHEQLVSATQWQPIETAPKDGTQIIVCGSYTDDVAIVRWDAKKKDWLCLADGVAVIESAGDCWTEYAYFSVPSHWMPTPAKFSLPDEQGKS